MGGDAPHERLSGQLLLLRIAADEVGERPHGRLCRGATAFEIIRPRLIDPEVSRVGLAGQQEGQCHQLDGLSGG